MSVCSVLYQLLRGLLKPRRLLAMENLALRQQLLVLQRSRKRRRLGCRNRLFWVALSYLWRDWHSILVIVKPETVIKWHRQGFNVLYGFVVLLHDWRLVMHFNVTAHPTAFWTAQQGLEAIPEDTAPRFLLRDRDQLSGEYFRSRVAAWDWKKWSRQCDRCGRIPMPNA